MQEIWASGQPGSPHDPRIAKRCEGSRATVNHYLILGAFLAAYDHSGKKGQVNFLRGVMGFANAQRALEYIRVFTEFISQPQYSNVVPMFGIMNEPVASKDDLTNL